MKQHNLYRLEMLALLLIVSLAAYVRLANSATNPAWYTDEGTHVEIARHLARGRARYLAIDQSTLLFAKLPVFEYLLALVFRVWGVGIAQLRVLTGLLGVVTVVTLYGVVRQMARDVVLALLAALMLALYPQAVLYSRFGFSYNWVAPLVLLTYYGLWHYLEHATGSRRGLILAALAVGIGLISEVWMLALVPPLLLVVVWRRWRDLWWSVLLMSGPFCLYAGVMLLQAPQAFVFDLGYTLSRLGARTLPQQVTTLALNYTVLISKDHWAALALVGLFSLRPARLHMLSLLFFLGPICFLGRHVALYNLSFYYLIPLLPFVALGMAVTLIRGVPLAFSVIRRGWKRAAQRVAPRFQSMMEKLAGVVAGLVILGVVGVPFVTSLLCTVRQTSEGFSTIIDPFLLTPQDAWQVANFVNAHADAEDVVIASPTLAWMLAANIADFQMVAAFAGHATPHLPSNVPAARWKFDPSYARARFVIVDNIWRRWAVMNVPGVGDMLASVASWPIVLSVGQVTVYCNPSVGVCL